MAIYSPSTARSNCILSRLRTLVKLQRNSHTVPEGGGQTQLFSDVGSIPTFVPGTIESSSWRVLDTRKIGIDGRKIPLSPTLVLQILKEKGFDAYLVGGCVRDLLLHKVPKDYDVITTAKLPEIRRIFHRCEIVGRRFPICRVHIKGSVVEVSSFETVTKQDKEKGELVLPPTAIGYDQRDFMRWTNCMRRDFTVNSLFFNPLAHRIYDYANALSDLWSSKMRTLIPAQLSFQEDCARILRGLRLAARLNFSFSKETESAIRGLGSSIQKLAKSRILMELDYMLSYGAAEPSLQLLQRFHLLDILLPIQAAHLSQQASKASGDNSLMLMKLFANLDHLVSCARPAHGCLWVSLFAFHQALVFNPQQALVVMTFASVLYHGKWVEGVQFAREHAKDMHIYVPEISDCFDTISDDELGEKVSQFGVQVQNSVNALTEVNDLLETMANLPGFACSGLVFVPRNLGNRAKQVFQIMHQEVTSLRTNRKGPEIDFDSLGKGHVREARFVLGKIILNTLVSDLLQDEVVKQEKDDPCVLDIQRKAKAHVRIHPAVADRREHHPPTIDKIPRVKNNTNLSDDGRKGDEKEEGSKQPRDVSRKQQNLVEDSSCVLKKDEKKTLEKVGSHRLHQRDIMTLLKTSKENQFDLSVKYQKHDDNQDQGIVVADFLKILDDSSDEDDKKSDEKCHSPWDSYLEQPMEVVESNVHEKVENKNSREKKNVNEMKQKSNQVKLSCLF